MLMYAGAGGVVINCSLADVARVKVDMISVDPPWRQGNLTYWSRKADREQRWDDFVPQLLSLCQTPHVHLKVGRPESDQWMAGLERCGYCCARFETTYYAGLNAQVIASREATLPACCAVDSRDATMSVIEWATNLGVRTVYDPCIGLGKMAQKWQRHGATVFGTELVASRCRDAAKRLGLQEICRLTADDVAWFIERAAADRVTVHGDDENYGIPGVAIGALNWRGQRAKLRGCWVHPDHRGHGIGKGLVLLRWFLAWAHVARTVETFAFNRDLFVGLGFSAKQDYQMGTTRLVQR